MLQRTKRQVELFEMHWFTMFMTALWVTFLVTLRWPKNKSLMQKYILKQVSASGAVFLKFCKFQPQYSYKVYSYKRV